MTRSIGYNINVVYRFTLNLTVIFAVCIQNLAFQEKPRTGRKPVLIRADPDEMEKEEEKIKIHDPEQAKKSVEIGDFYAKRNNYDAAEMRYREAIEYNLKWDVSYRKLIKLLEKQDKYAAAMEICRLFIENNPDSEKVKSFQKSAQKLQKKLPSTQ